MRVLLLADVHANWEALLALQRAEPEPDAVLFAGDAVGYGPSPVECARWLLARSAAAVRGDHEECLMWGECPSALPELRDAARETLDYARRLLPRTDRDGLARCPASAQVPMGGAAFYLTHGTPADPFGGRLDPATCSEHELHSLFDGVAGDFIVLGNTHVPALRKFGARLIINPGSLGQPRYGVPDGTYAVWTDGDVRIKHLHYDHDATIRKLRLAPLSPETRELLVKILETGME